MWRVAWKGEPEGTSFACGALHADLTAMGLYAEFAEGQTQAGRVFLAFASGLNLAEFFEDLIVELRGDAASRVFDGHPRCSVSAGYVDLDPAFRRGEMDGVAH